MSPVPPTPARGLRGPSPPPSSTQSLGNGGFSLSGTINWCWTELCRTAVLSTGTASHQLSGCMEVSLFLELSSLSQTFLFPSSRFGSASFSFSLGGLSPSQQTLCGTRTEFLRCEGQSRQPRLDGPCSVSCWRWTAACPGALLGPPGRTCRGLQSRRQWSPLSSLR